MSRTLPVDTLRVGMSGSGFIANFHLQGMLGVRNVEVRGIFSPTQEHRQDAAKKANDLGLGPCKDYATLEELVRADDIDAVWMLGPNYTRVENMKVIYDLVTNGEAELMGVACEKPLARNVKDAQTVLELAEDAGINHAYLENQVYAPGIQRGKEIIWRRGAANSGRPYLARTAEEHSGPHRPWFWKPDRQGGGVLSDMMCHTVEVGRELLTPPDGDKNDLTLKSAEGSIANLKWSRPEYIEKLKRMTGGEVDYGDMPAEDFARGLITLKDEEGEEILIETSTSWSFVGAGIKIAAELLGPEYSMDWSTIESSLNVFFSREVTGEAGEDLVEKQNAEQGLMPVIEDEAKTYGYTDEDRHVVEHLRKGEEPMETFKDGLVVMRMLMALYQSSEEGRKLTFPIDGIEDYVPAPVRGEYQG